LIIVARRVQRDAAQDVAERNAEEQDRDAARHGEDHVPGTAPAGRFSLAAELERYGSRHERQQEEHERQVEAAEDRGVDGRKGAEENAARGEQPDLVAVPHRPHGVQHRSSLVVSLRTQVPEADPQVEAVEDGVADEEHTQQDEPDHLKLGHPVTSGPFRTAFAIRSTQRANIIA
jgi:hypothetical protein